MTDARLERLARSAGIAVEWTDYAGADRRVAPPVLRRILGALHLPCDSDADVADSLRRLELRRDARPRALTGDAGSPIALPPGFTIGRGVILCESGAEVPLADVQAALPVLGETGRHRLIADGTEITLCVAPQRCWTIAEAIGDAHAWGAVAQIYGLRRAGDCGIGDMGSVAVLAERLAAAGAAALALSPAHALFAADPSAYSPYSPSSRLFLNALLADPAAALGEERCAAALHKVAPEAPRRRLETGELIDWPHAHALKMAWLRELFADIRRTSGLEAAALAAFRKAGGAALARHARFEASHDARRDASGVPLPWRLWRAPGPDLTDGDAVAFHGFLQWLAACSHEQAHRRARQAGMSIGLIADVAVGVSPDGSDAWSDQASMLVGLQIGAPPDLINRAGQNWGLTTFSPLALRDTACAPFAAMLRAAMAHAGGVRLDHVMGLRRLWLIPEGADPTDGAYLAYPFDDLIRCVTLESRRRKAVVIAEDLGTVPPGFRGTLAARGVCGMNVLWFERAGAGFATPEDWPANGVAMTSTHDLPTLAGWWSGADLAWREAAGLAGGEEAAAVRRRDRAALWRAIRAHDPSAGPAPAASDAQAFVDRAIDFTAAGEAGLCLVPMEDLVGTPDQPNMPGTIDQHPNWRRRMPHEAAQSLAEPRVARRARLLSARRPAR
ncbi:4-alpha-glucanotransferase [Phreatobacter sp. AB_2022a]|uniref:4-alpha-glucanotransferase n=1 Tax=Phreatobacter sp. AB_2022a TaxID=3003134 RepID=UPI0022871DAE|nr:4-alpha-glucanotransferase [Phreatobacter sp. AB_2022a]MCZ0735514.1 4-alpha-glucanotransferase [Phreatobacter sp. AB_2022a]